MTNTNTTTTSQGPRFVVGQKVSVWEPKGVRNLKAGPSSSERTGGDFADILPSEELLVLKTFGSTKALVQREDGTEIFMHLNHIDPAQGYNTSTKAKVAPKKEMTPAEKIEALKAIRAKKLAELEALKEQEELAELEAEMGEEAQAING